MTTTERECEVLAQALVRVGAYPLNYARTTAGVRAWARSVAEAGAELDIDSTPQVSDEEWLTEHSIAWSLEVNPERHTYEDRREYLISMARLLDDDPPEDIDALVAAPNLYALRAYPSTPTGFFDLHATSREDAFRQMREAIASDHD